MIPALLTSDRRSGRSPTRRCSTSAAAPSAVDDVALHGMRRAAGRRDPLAHRRRRVGVARVVDGHLGAGGGQLGADRGADASRAAGDQRDPARRAQASGQALLRTSSTLARGHRRDAAVDRSRRSASRARASTVPEPISTNVSHAVGGQRLHGLGEPHRRASAARSAAQAPARAVSIALVTVDMNRVDSSARTRPPRRRARTARRRRPSAGCGTPPRRAAGSTLPPASLDPLGQTSATPCSRPEITTWPGQL